MFLIPAITCTSRLLHHNLAYFSSVYNVSLTGELFIEGLVVSFGYRHVARHYTLVAVQHCIKYDKEAFYIVGLLGLSYAVATDRTAIMSCENRESQHYKRTIPVKQLQYLTGNHPNIMLANCRFYLVCLLIQVCNPCFHIAKIIK